MLESQTLSQIHFIRALDYPINQHQILAPNTTTMTTKPPSQPFWLGGAAGSLAACITHPLDQTKYRMQTMTSNQGGLFRTLIYFGSRDGALSLWQGISASILRQSTYSTARFGLYNYFAAEARSRSGQVKLSSMAEMGCAAMAGGIAGMIGNPTEVALVRMCADGAKEPGRRFMYRNCFDAIVRIGTG